MESTLMRVVNLLRRGKTILHKFPDDKPAQVANRVLPKKFDEGSNVDVTTHSGQVNK